MKRRHATPLTILLLALFLGLGVTLGQGSHSSAEPAQETHDHHDHEAHEHGDDHAHEDEHGDDPMHDHEHEDDHAHDDHAHDADHAHDHEHQHGELAGVRLLVASLDGPELIVLDAQDGHVLGSFTTPGPGRVYQLPDPQLAGVVHRDANRVSFVHSGLTAVDHGDHADLLEGSPYVLQTVNVGPMPTHFVARGHDIAIFLDGDGTMAWLDARLLGISLDFVDVPGRGADHGALAVVDGYLVGGGLNEAAVRVYDRSATQLAAFGGCPGLHGQAVRDDAVAFGCSDGVLLVSHVGGGVFTSHKIANPPGSPEGARVGTLAGHDGSPVLVGNFGQGIALIDARARTVAPVPLPAAPAGMRFSEDGARLLVLTLDGFLHALESATGEVLGSVEVLEPWAQGAPRPSFTHLGDHAFVVDPDHGAVWVIDLDHLEVETHYELPFTPGSAAVLAIPGAVIH